MPWASEFLERVGTCQWTVLWFLFLPDFGTCVPELSVYGWPAETGQEHSCRSSGAWWDCEFWVKSQVCFALGTSLPDAALLQLYSFLQRSCLQRRKTILFLLLLKATFTASNGKAFNGLENSLLAQNLELWLLNASKNSLQTWTPVLVLASEVGKPEVYKSGHCWMAMLAAWLISYSCWNICRRLSGRNPALCPAQQTQLSTRSWEITGWQHSEPAGLVCFLTPAAFNQSHPHCSDLFYFRFHIRSLHFLAWWWLISS